MEPEPEPEGGEAAVPQETELITAEGEQVGIVTSGVQSPCLKKPIGMAYVQSQYQPAGSELLVEVGGKKQPLTVTKMPFTPPGYYRGPE